MPHITVEYTDTLSLDIPKLLDQLHYALAAHDTINVQAIKTRAIPVLYSIVGDQHNRDVFIHITVKLLAGRDEALRQKIAQDLHAKAKSHIPDGSGIALSLEVHEMDAATYQK